MKKIYLLFVLFIFILFLIPIVCTKKYNNIAVSTQDISKVNIQNNIDKLEEGNITNIYDYGKYNTIKLLHKKSGEIEQICLDEYLYGVVSAEMPATFEVEALKAQAIVARTYTIYKIIQGNKHEGADICDDSSCCQAWISKEERLSKWDSNIANNNWDKIKDAVDSTKGKIITYDNKPINAFFHANSGGKTEVPINVWGGSGYPYLQVVETAGEDTYSQYLSNVEFNFDEFKNKISEKHKNLILNNFNEIKILDYTDSERVKTVRIGNIELAGVELRTILGLKSTKFDFNVDNNVIRFNVIGYGHGVGMSQTGANSLAKNHLLAEDILKHFYIGVEIKDF